MKKLILALVFFGIAGASFAQKFDYYYKTDTFTNADTITLYEVTLKDDYYYSFEVTADSLSGATAGTVWLQAQNCNSCSTWYNIDTVTINGTSTISRDTGTLVGRRIRIYGITSGTQSTEYFIGLALARREN